MNYLVFVVEGIRYIIQPLFGYCGLLDEITPDRNIYSYIPGRSNNDCQLLTKYIIARFLMVSLNQGA